MNYLDKIIGDIEEHAVAGIVDCFNNGVSANDLYNEQPLIFELTSEYTRSPRFKDCVRAFINAGLIFEDKALLAVLADDSDLLESCISLQPDIIHKKYNLRCAYTPLSGVSLLHICAEFNHVSCANVLVANHADVNQRASTDGFGFGGQTPVFHTVNQNANQSADMLHFLIAQGAGLEITVKGITWGNGYPWETLIPGVNPISYAMMGLIPQMHRNEKTVANTVSLLLKAAYGIDYQSTNIPNRYLQQ